MEKFVALDVETANEDIGSICSIGIAYFENNNLKRKYYSLINPHDIFSPINTYINRITPEDVVNAPDFADFFNKFSKHINNIPIVSHTSFDIRAIKKASQSLLFDSIKTFDSYLISRKLINTPHHRLQDLATFYSIPNPNLHNALNDAIVCGKIIVSMLKDNNVNTTLDLCHRAGYYQFGSLSSSEYISFSHYNCESSNNLKEKHHRDPIKANQIVKLSDPNDIESINGKKIVFTGKLETMTRKEAENLVIKHNGIFQKNVTKTTDLLVIGIEDKNVVGKEGKSAKIKKAELLRSNGSNIEIIDESDFLKLIQ